MSDSFDGRGRRPPQHTERVPPPRPRRPDPAAPRTGAFHGQDRRWSDPADPVTGSAPVDYDYEPPHLRTGPPHTHPRQAELNDIEPPVDALQHAWLETMGPDAKLEAERAPVPQSPPPPLRSGAPRRAAEPPRRDEDLFAPTRTAAPGRELSYAPIVPAGSVTGRSLNLVIVIMCFLACLTAGAVYMMNQAASAWLRDIASEVTVQIEPRDKADLDKLVRDVAQFLNQQPGIANVRPLSAADSMKLTSEWLPQSDSLSTLPVPRLIAVEVDRDRPPNFDLVRAGIASRFKGVSLDDHRHWQQQIRTVTRSFALGGLAILMLVGAATTAIIVSATRSALASNREIVEVLHFVGATDRFIAREFEKHFLRLGIRAGIIGAMTAMVVFTALPFVMQFLGGGTVTLAELQRLIGTGSLDLPGFVLLGIVVVVIAALCMLTSRIGVYRILNSQH